MCPPSILTENGPNGELGGAALIRRAGAGCCATGVAFGRCIPAGGALIRNAFGGGGPLATPGSGGILTGMVFEPGGMELGASPDNISDNI